MKILVVGGGGREHAIVKKLHESKYAPELFCAPGNGGIASIATCLPIKATDVQGIVNAAEEYKFDLVFVAPDDPLMLGTVDALEAKGIRAFGPRQCAAIIEGSKVFSKELMKKYSIPTANYEVFEDAEKALEYIRTQNDYPTVIKADGLALGKGVIIAKDYAEAEDAVKSIMCDKVFGESGSRVVIEEFLTGPEVSVLAFTDGKTIVPMVSAQDHKRALDNDQGLNTGGMGAFSPSKNYTESVAEECYRTIYKPTMDAMNKEGRTFKGVIYFGLMLTPKGPRVIEYNARFGDPETQAVLPRLKTDFVDIINAVIDEKLDEISIEWDNGAAVCIVLASGGYPTKYESGKEIFGLDHPAFDADDLFVYHAGTKAENGKIYTAGGRVLGVTATGKDLDDAIAKSYKALKNITFDKMHYRNDIGRK